MAKSGSKKSKNLLQSFHLQISGYFVTAVAIFSAGYGAGAYITEIRLKWDDINNNELQKNLPKIVHDTIATNNNVQGYATKAEFEEFKKNYIQNNNSNGTK